MEERIRYTLAHEMCHLATWTIDATPSENHGPLFRKWCVGPSRITFVLNVHTQCLGRRRSWRHATTLKSQLVTRLPNLPVIVLTA